ncbi:MAG: hypothetical protein L0215_19035 [Gemmataceae bacterium]|nr:hypothetical protein [Gemmataceae bacterium]
MPTNRVTIRLSAPWRRHLARLSKSRGKTTTDLIREALEKCYRLGKEPKHESCFDIAKRIGFIGCASGLPADASTNPEYLEGLGRE